jgi:hypothetical protein
MKASRFLLSATLALVLMTAFSVPAKAEPYDDYLKGFISVLLKFELHQPDISVDVKSGHVSLTGLAENTRQADMRKRLLAIDGVRGVTFGKSNAQNVTHNTQPKTRNQNNVVVDKIKWSKRLLFAPAIADPRSPRFSAGLHNYFGNNKLSSVGTVSFGETLSLVDMMNDGTDAHWEIRNHEFDLNFQGAVFSIFDLDGLSKDLVNSDFWAALALSWRRRTDSGDFSAMSRVFHQSSHLGDEYILFNKISEQDRVNLSYEGLDLTMAWQPGMGYGIKYYAGGGYLFGREPSSLDPWSAKVGMEVEWPKEKWGIYPVAAIHIQTFEDTGFEPDLSVMGGLQFNDPALEDRQIRILLSYFNGYSPNGQFYDEQLEYIGLGFQYQF